MSSKISNAIENIITKYIPLIEEISLQKKMEKLYINLHKQFPLAMWGRYKHQVWKWGYYDHILDCLDIAMMLYKTLNSYRQLSFTFSDMVIVLLLHDLEKPYKHSWTKWSQESIRNSIINSYNIILSEKQKNAIKYAHGEWDDFSQTKRIMNPLAALCHSVDTISARIYYDKKTK